MGLRVSREEFVKKYIGDLKKRFGEDSIVIKKLREDAESLYDQVTEHGVILLDEDEVRGCLKELQSKSKLTLGEAILMLFLKAILGEQMHIKVIQKLDIEKNGDGEA